MSPDLTFKGVCLAIKKHSHDEPQLIDAVDKLLGLAVICSPIVLGPPSAALLPTLAVKGELVRIGKRALDKLTGQSNEDYVLRYEAMRNAYGLLVFTAFFDTLDARIPKSLRRRLQLLDSEKAFLANDGVKKSSAHTQDDALCERQERPVSSMGLVFPHPTETLSEQCQRQQALWKQMGQSFIEFIQKLAFWDTLDISKQTALLSALDQIEEEAARRFEAQYFELARTFEDFAVWANLHAQSNSKALVGELSGYVKQLAKLSTASNKSIDVGFVGLREAVQSIPEILRTEQAAEIVDSFNRHYRARINDPIIEDKDISDESGPRLSFPKVCDAFVPQSFRVLRQAGKSRRLEDEATWNVLERRSDLGVFFLSYLTSPYSTETPLLILGHPGSGKSLLTTVLSAQLMSKHFTAIRVPLREVNADADIQTQIEEYIKRISGVGFDSWIKLRSQFKNCPPVIILDGYDELLQASGQVFASYIMDAQRFQQHQQEQGWPVRIIITSRVTLIDKAAVPAGSTVVRLLEFNELQRACWSTIWNEANASYFLDANVEKFVLPSYKEKGAEKVLSLAEQPLLLLMLALYDSQNNQLRTSKGLDRTKLYDSLLRRFVIRERSKERGFSDSEGREQDKALATEMQRLGAAALGMYNRRQVHILSTELDDDLEFFQLRRPVSPSTGKALSQADLLLGSFFFVHKSKAQHRSGAEETHEESSAFEFLHNTFGEFLTADFIVRRAVAQVEALRAAEEQEALRVMIDRMMGTADGFERDWFASLVYTPLFTRPVVLEMIQEWAPHVLKEHSLSEEHFVGSLDKIILNQIKRMLNKREMPQIMRKETAQEGYRVPFADHPLVGHIAIYSINLVLLRLVSGSVAFEFDESEIASFEDGTRPWDRLTHIWRSWFSLENLNGLTGVMLAVRNKAKIQISVKSRIQAKDTKARLNEVYNVAGALGDNTSAGMSGLYLFDPQRDSIEDFIKIEKQLAAEGLELGLHASITKLLALTQRPDEFDDRFTEHCRRTIEQAFQASSREYLEFACSIAVRAVEGLISTTRPTHNPQRVWESIFPPGLCVEIALRDPRSAKTFLQLSQRFSDPRWTYEFTERLLDYFLHRVTASDTSEYRLVDRQAYLQLIQAVRSTASFYRRHLEEIFRRELERWTDPRRLLDVTERSPEVAVEYLQILKELVGARFFKQSLARRTVSREFFRRVFNQDHLLELMDRNPDKALAYIQVVYEMGGGRSFHDLGLQGEFLERQLLELIGRNPHDAMLYLQILSRMVGDHYYKGLLSHHLLSDETLEYLLYPDHLLHQLERNAKAALKYLAILRELSGGRYFGQFMYNHVTPDEYFDRILDLRHLLNLLEHDGFEAIAYIQVLHELGDGHYFEEFLSRHLPPEDLLERMIHPRNLPELIERNPEGATAYFGLLHNLDGGRYLQAFISRYRDHFKDEDAIDQILDFEFADSFSGSGPRSLAVWLSLVRSLNSKSITLRLGTLLMGLLERNPSLRSEISILPIASYSDLRWLAAESDLHNLKTEVSSLLA